MSISDYSDSDRTRVRKRLWAFFSKYDPEKLSSSESNNNIIDKTLTMPISESVCFEKMCLKYAVDPNDEEMNAKKMNLFPNQQQRQVEINDDNHDHQIQIQSKNSIQTYSASEKQRLAKRLEKFFTELVLGESSPSEMRQKIEKLLVGDVSECDLMKRLCDLHRVDMKM